MADSQKIVDDYPAALAQLHSALAVPAELDCDQSGLHPVWSPRKSRHSRAGGNPDPCCYWVPACAGTTNPGFFGAPQGLPECLSPKAGLRQAFTSGWIGAYFTHTTWRSRKILQTA